MWSDNLHTSLTTVLVQMKSQKEYKTEMHTFQIFGSQLNEFLICKCFGCLSRVNCCYFYFVHRNSKRDPQ